MKSFCFAIQKGKKHLALQEIPGIKTGTREAIDKLTADIIAA